MDFSRDPYTVSARVHHGEGAPIVKLLWYPTVLPPIDFESVINNRRYEDQPHLDRPIGELPIGENQYKQVNRWDIVPGLTGLHVCYKQYFPVGEPWPNDLPENEYDDWDIPTCCGTFHDPGIFGVEIGGECGDRIGYKNPTSGGLMIGGAMGDKFHAGDGAEGGVEIGGRAGDVLRFTDSAAGGVEIGGAAGDAFDGTDPAEGGVEIGGETGDVFDAADSAEGGVEIGGEMGDRYYHASPSAGGVVIGGAAGDAHRYTDGASGGVEIGGAAGDVFTPPLVPGSSCAAAGALPQGTTYSGPLPGMLAVDWWTFTAPVSGTLHFTFVPSGGGLPTAQAMEGGACPTPNPVLYTTSGPPTWKWTATAGDQCWISVSATSSGGSYTLVWDVG